MALVVAEHWKNGNSVEGFLQQAIDTRDRSLIGFNGSSPDGMVYDVTREVDIIDSLKDTGMQSSDAIRSTPYLNYSVLTTNLCEGVMDGIERGVAVPVVAPSSGSVRRWQVTGQQLIVSAADRLGTTCPCPSPIIGIVMRVCDVGDMIVVGSGRDTDTVE